MQPHDARTLTTAAFLAIALVMLTAGGSSTTEASPRACPDALEYRGDQFNARGATDDLHELLGTAMRGECADVAETTGVSFPEGGESTEVWSLPGFDPVEAIGAEGSDGVVYFYLAVDLTAKRADAIVSELSGSE